jgi:hypothetical protein
MRTIDATPSEVMKLMEKFTVLGQPDPLTWEEVLDADGGRPIVGEVRVPSDWLVAPAGQSLRIIGLEAYSRPWK